MSKFRRDQGGGMAIGVGGDAGGQVGGETAGSDSPRASSRRAVLVNKPTPREVDEMARCLRLFIARRPMTQGQLAVVFGCSRAKIARIETMALRKIRAVMEGVPSSYQAGETQ